MEWRSVLLISRFESEILSPCILSLRIVILESVGLDGPSYVCPRIFNHVSIVQHRCEYTEPRQGGRWRWKGQRFVFSPRSLAPSIPPRRPQVPQPLEQPPHPAAERPRRPPEQRGRGRDAGDQQLSNARLSLRPGFRRPRIKAAEFASAELLHLRKHRRELDSHPHPHLHCTLHTHS